MGVQSPKQIHGNLSEKFLIFSKKIKCSKQPKKLNKLNFYFSLSGVLNVRGGWVGSGVLDKGLKKTDFFFDTFPKRYEIRLTHHPFLRCFTHLRYCIDVHKEGDWAKIYIVISCTNLRIYIALLLQMHNAHHFNRIIGRWQGKADTIKQPAN